MFRTGYLRRLALIGTAVLLALALGGTPTAMAGGQSGLAGLRQATDAFHDLSVATAAEYGLFYRCTDENSGLGAMGQHYVNGKLVGDPEVDPLRPEALVYAPKRGGGYRLVAVEWVTFVADWQKTHAGPPSLFGQTFTLVPSPNRYGLPPFYALHAWIWDPNPSGMFANWNPRVSCLGNGDPA
jgi:hypothetical protein